MLLVCSFAFFSMQRTWLDTEHLELLTVDMTTTDVRDILGEPNWIGTIPPPPERPGQEARDDFAGDWARWVYNRPFGMRSVTVYFDQTGHFDSFWYNDWFD